jgi:FAD/FMN-containing dehydrogenase
MKMKLFSAVLLSTALLVACGGDEESPDVEGCEHLKEGPNATVTATATGTGAPAVSNDHKRYDITLVDVTGGKGGSVSFAASEGTDYILFTSADVPVEVKSSSGQTVAPEASVKTSAECTEIKGRHTFGLGVGTYTISFGPTTATSVSLVIEEGESDHQH